MEVSRFGGLFVKQIKGLDSCLKFERAIIGKSNSDNPRIDLHTQPLKRFTFSLRLPCQTVRQSLANSLQLLHQTMKRNSPPFSLQLSRRTKSYGCWLYCFIMQQATIPLSTSLTSSSRVYFHLCMYVCISISFLTRLVIPVPFSLHRLRTLRTHL